MNRPIIAITMGDPAGIGPEIILKGLAELRPRIAAGELGVVVTGCAAVFASTASSLGLPDPFVAAGEGIRLEEVGTGADAEVRPGAVSAFAGELAFRAVARAVELASRGVAAAICTAPINKEAMNLAGHHYSGHTELLADLTGARDSVMMLAHGGMRVSHVTTHVALEDVPKKVTPARIRRVVELTVEALERLGIAKPRIAIAALNPHAGEGGLFGRQDIDITEPLVTQLTAEGYTVLGPIPGDTVFVKLRAGQYDAVVAMYHDQGHIPVKLLGFSVDPDTGSWDALSGVNITLGLPILRTSVDHGTAFDIAGRGIANATSLLEAIQFAVQLAARR